MTRTSRTTRTHRTLVVPGVVVCLLVPAILHAQLPPISVLVRGTYTTTAKVYANPASASPALRDEYTEVTGLTGFGVELQMPVFRDDFSVSLSAEYLSHVDEAVNPIALGGILRMLPMRDGFSVIPVELSAVAIIPIESRSMRLTMAGGGGAYFAHRILEIAGAGTRSQGSTVGYGIHISVGFDYQVLRGVWAHAGVRFRDPDLTLGYTFDRTSVTYNNTVIPLPTSTMHTRVNVDGTTLTAGLLIDLTSLIVP